MPRYKLCMNYTARITASNRREALNKIVAIIKERYENFEQFVSEHTDIER